MNRNAVDFEREVGSLYSIESGRRVSFGSPTRIIDSIPELAAGNENLSDRYFNGPTFCDRGARLLSKYRQVEKTPLVWGFQKPRLPEENIRKCENQVPQAMWNLCFGCRRSGHRFKDCPVRGETYSKFCQKCGKRGVDTANCPRNHPFN